MPKHLPGADFLRALCTLGVVTYHFSCTLIYYNINCNPHILYRFANGNWGLVFVTMFFMLSGALLYKNNSTIMSYKSFYVKRWKSIFPMFYMAFLIFYIPTAVSNHSLFYLGKPFSMILTLLGMDGYFLYKIPNYYLLGEWFLGAIIFLYILYPLFLKFLSKPILTTCILVLLHIWQVYTDFFTIHNFFNLISCLISFWLGMLFMKYYVNIMNFLNAGKVIILAILTVPFILIKFSLIPNNFVIHLLGYILFVLSFYFGNIIMKNKYISKSCTFVSYISYGIFLLHHQLLFRVLGNFSNISFTGSVFLLMGMYVLCMISAYILTKLCNYIMHFLKNR